MTQNEWEFVLDADTSTVNTVYGYESVRCNECDQLWFAWTLPMRNRKQVSDASTNRFLVKPNAHSIMLFAAIYTLLLHRHGQPNQDPYQACSCACIPARLLAQPVHIRQSRS